MKLKNIILAVSFPALFVGILLYSSSENEDARQIEELRRNVEVLPEGVEEEWNLYLEGRLQFLIAVKGAQLQLNTGIFSWEKAPEYVSRNMPYSIECNSFTGGSISFGTGEGAILVPVFGLLANVDKEGILPPDLGVSKFSIAAKDLFLSSCEQLSIYMNQISSGYE